MENRNTAKAARSVREENWLDGHLHWNRELILLSPFRAHLADVHQAGLIVADLMNKNENVMYEIGIAHTVGKLIVLISQDEVDPPFDIGHHRVHMYEDTSAGPEDLKAKLPGIIDDVTEEHERRKQQEMHLPPPPSNYYAGGPYPHGGLLH